ncbi:MAG: ZIP family metal transporter [Candidatus Methanomethylophilaceae archaeon]
MDPIITFLVYAIVLFAVSMAGAYVPFIRRLSDTQVHLLVALSAGIFLGILFLMLLPEAVTETTENGYDTNTAMICVLTGFLMILFVDVIIKHFHMRKCTCECHEDEHSHSITSLSAFIGLSVHACVDGLALATALLAGESVGILALIGMSIHKFVVLFSLSSTFLLVDQPRKKSLTYLLAFSLITPIAGMISFIILNGISVEGVAGLPLAFAAGTFMYVALCDMVPEAFHRKNQDLKSFLFLMIGLGICAAAVIAMNYLGGHLC